ncbi:MAG: TerC/Alx family metal homeostasis membrane protein [Paracoccaceae bacterium]
MDLLLVDLMGKPLWLWLGFLGVVAGLLALDLGVLHRESRAIGVAGSLRLSALYVALGLGFSAVVWAEIGQTAALHYLTGFVLEKSLALDNIFVIALVFAHFGIPREYQHRVLVWGILGVVVLRGMMIAAGAAIVSEFEWVLLLFALFLVATGVRMLAGARKTHDIGASPVLRFLRRHLNVTDRLHGARFFVRRPDAAGRLALFATPLFLALVMVELADAMFALDSIPAIFAITTDPYVVLTSNVFAILGLRALFFALSAMLERFVYLDRALALVLIVIGAKVLGAEAMGIEKVPAALSLGVTLAILAGGVALSLRRAPHAAGSHAAD